MMTVIMFFKLAWERMTKAIFYSSSGKVGRQLGLIRPFITALSPIQLLAKKALSVCGPAGSAMASAF